MTDEIQPKNIGEKVDKVLDLLEGKDEAKAKKKLFRLPMKAKVGAAKAKRGWVTVLKVNSNRILTAEKQPIEEQTIIVDGVPRIVTATDVMLYKNKPIIILPSWSVKPFSPIESVAETERNQLSSVGYKLLLNRMKKEVINTKMNVGGWGIWLGIVALVVIGYLVFKGGLFS